MSLGWSCGWQPGVLWQGDMDLSGNGSDTGHTQGELLAGVSVYTDELGFRGADQDGQDHKAGQGCVAIY